MEFTWKQFLELLENTFEISRTKLAFYFVLNKSTISRLYAKPTTNFRMSNDEIYKKIFDPTHKKSLAYETYPGIPQKDIENSLFYTLRQVIKDQQWEDATKEIQCDNYTDYVKSLIKLARTNSSKLSAKKKTENRKITPSSPTVNMSSASFTPSQYRQCLYCEYFKIAETIHKYVADTLGTCTLECKKMFSANPACDHFQANEGKITQELLKNNFPFRDKFHL